MTYIIDRLYLGDLEDACDTVDLHNKGITHIMTVDSKPLYLEKRDGFAYSHVQALDMEDTNLLQHFPQCFTFIDQGREQGAVLVHCFAGQSRSATILLAYMMNKLDLSLQDAVTLVRKQRPQIRPNPGFQSQLELFEEMGNTVDQSNQQYKMYKLKILAMKMSSAQIQDAVPEESLSLDPSLAPSTGETVYKCKKCRRALFKKSAILPHDVGRGEAAFDWRTHVSTDHVVQSEGAERGGHCRQCLFLEPVQWMARDIHLIEGKLNCPKCNTKLGSFDWKGERCPCGTWVTPAFHINASKVDEARPRAVQQPLPIRDRRTQQPAVQREVPPPGVKVAPPTAGIS